MKVMTNTIIVISCLLIIYYLYLQIPIFGGTKMILGVISIILLTGPLFMFKINKIKLKEYIKLIYYFFLLTSFILGILFSFYYSTMYFDLFVHFIYGLLFSIIILEKIQVSSFKNIILVLSIVIFVGFIWETLEFMSDFLLGTDHQEKISGSFDTMGDLLMAMIGGLISCFISLLRIKKKNKLHNNIGIS